MIKTVNHKNDIPYFGDKPLLETVPNADFSDMIYELLSGQKPDKFRSQIFRSILNISIDHGEDTPSAIETIKAAGDGKSISESVAAGITQINNTHGGAIEPAMELFYKILYENLTVAEFVKNSIAQGERLAGFGHRIYETDPRTKLLFELYRKNNSDTKYLNLAENISEELTKIKGKTLPVNIDGAIAAILCEFGWNPNLGKAVFIIARTPGLCGQYLRVKEKQQP